MEEEGRQSRVLVSSWRLGLRESFFAGMKSWHILDWIWERANQRILRLATNQDLVFGRTWPFPWSIYLFWQLVSRLWGLFASLHRD